MKNSECTVYIVSKKKWLQKFKKEKTGWTLTTTKGTVYACTAEQVLSHILPVLAGVKGSSCSVKVKLNVENVV
ncbi:MAG: hypothetical protein QXU99_03510 [Candidatus Bathyarchaeia archaeon]